ncbi:ATP-binding protein [Aeromonas veronii]|uniref:ATP-binding protein n=1 Tax=Aeromonas veronii TaxID=654 RepID=A0AAN1UP72_AERVE|nr:ATP-binding protein [Aeromonas veronii]AYV36550.1 hypothetical protein EFI48_06860 [Aeromonas veronii]MCX0435126.1 ATP-binding protein [Aeromonas veronii]MCX0438221.1 ATP-binding protein [Aeromonas veronii]
MNARYLKTTDQSIKSQITNISPEQAISEYIWNGFDANAKRISITTEINAIQGMSSITILDDGDGIDIDDLDNTLDLFLDSKKKNISKPTTRGKKGRGRFSFIKFCEKATWETSNGKKSFEFTIDSGRLSQYEPKISHLDCEPQKTGTTVRFEHIKKIDFNYFNDTIVPYLKNEFTWLLISNKTLDISINGLSLERSKFNNLLVTETISDFTFDINSIFLG